MEPLLRSFQFSLEGAFFVMFKNTKYKNKYKNTETLKLND